MLFIKKILFRIFRIITGRRGIYCKKGKKNKFKKNIYMNERTTIGNYNYFGDNVMTFNCQIGNYCSIASGCKIGQLEHDLKCVSTSTHIFGKKNGITNFTGILNKTIIENDVWLGSNVVVKQGVYIGTGAVVGAGAVVTKDLPPYSISVGVPAKVIKYRFSKEIIKTLLESKWYEKNKRESIKECRQLQKKI